MLPHRVSMGYASFGLYSPTGVAQHWGVGFLHGQAGSDH